TMTCINVPSACAAGPASGDMGISSHPLKRPHLSRKRKTAGHARRPSNYPRSQASLRRFGHRLLAGALLVFVGSLLSATLVATAARTPRAARSSRLGSLVPGRRGFGVAA